MSKKKLSNLGATILDPTLPFSDRREILLELCADPGEESAATLASILDGAASAHGESLYAKKTKEVSELLQQMEQGPLRSGRFIRMIEDNGTLRRAYVALPDGSAVFPLVPDAGLAAALLRGDRVLIDAQGRVLLRRCPDDDAVGEEARFERSVGKDAVEVTLRDHERHIFRAAHALVEKLASKEVNPGSQLLVSPLQQFALDAVPHQDGLSHFRFLVKEPVPDVVVDRDIGSPPGFLWEVKDHIRMEMEDPAGNRRYNLHRAMMKFLTGVSGSGKTLCILAIWRMMYEIMSEMTGVPIEALPQRVCRLRTPLVMSMWLGESEKLLDRFFDEVNQLADQPFVAPDGREFAVPVLAIGEEFEALSRARGHDHEGHMDRIQTPILDRLDTTCQTIRDKFVLFLFTSNVPQLVDPAVLRRAGVTIETFSRLDRRGFLAVLEKQLRNLPVSSKEGSSPREGTGQLLADAASWFFSPNGADKGQVEIRFHGSSEPAIKYKRDFLTGALVQRAVHQAAAAARREEWHGSESPGLTSQGLLKALDRQVGNIVEQLTELNVGSYLTLPRGHHVSIVRPIEQPAIQPFELRRAS
jgi:hypothetical protein